MRVGLGFDIHRLAEGRPFVLGGVLIPFDKGPVGHSDGDALLHAVADALLGAAGLGDIGVWFPPDDSSIAGADSRKLLKSLYGEVRTRGWVLENLDAFVICEKPELKPHYDQIRSSMAQILETTVDKVGVKAKTYEGLGDLGSGQAIAAEAVVLLRPIN